MEQTDKVKKKRRIIYICGIGILIVGLVVYGIIRTEQQKSAVLEISENNSTSEASGEIVVHVAGAVKNPGIVKLKSGDRVADAINAAGGMTDDADSDALNLAAKVEDGQKITIRTRSETNASVSGATADGVVNINTADQKTLETLSGIGEVIAENIIQYREKNGGFSSIEEIKNVNRIGEKLFEQIKDRITV